MALAVLGGRRIMIETPETAEARIELWMLPLDDAMVWCDDVMMPHMRRGIGSNVVLGTACTQRPSTERQLPVRLEAKAAGSPLRLCASAKEGSNLRCSGVDALV